MLNHGLQMNDLQTELPAYPKLLFLTEKIEEAKNIRYSIPCGNLMSLENRSFYLPLP